MVLMSMDLIFNADASEIYKLESKNRILILIKNTFRTKCCYGLTMDLLDNIATELGFEFHLYVVRDQLFGSKMQRDVKDFIKSSTKSSQNSASGSESTSKQPTITDHDVGDGTFKSKYEDKQNLKYISQYVQCTHRPKQYKRHTTKLFCVLWL